jgi:hypothetical protein
MKFPIKTYSSLMYSYGVYSNFKKSDKTQLYVDRCLGSIMLGSIYLLPPIGLYNLAIDIEKKLIDHDHDKTN